MSIKVYRLNPNFGVQGNEIAVPRLTNRFSRSQHPLAFPQPTPLPAAPIRLERRTMASGSCDQPNLQTLQLGAVSDSTLVVHTFTLLHAAPLIMGPLGGRWGGPLLRPVLRPSPCVDQARAPPL
ncbi:hypothetical protein UY3_15434 [Chelonia mydas]|uniref:Uncharacterized protein n=1 Tax=Chelonia mydas TaxID=8469 RepID=M7AS51_CHEMY|nr:hypothetical protein UY3_15434 [Chelonia mydas]